MATNVTEQQLQKTLEKVLENAGKLSRATQSITEALKDTSDKFKKGRLEKAVKKTADDMGVALSGGTKGLQKFLISLNSQIKAYDAVTNSLEKLDFSNAESIKAYRDSTAEYLKAAKDAGQLKTIFGANLQQHEALIEKFITNTANVTEADLARMGAVFQTYTPKFQASISSSTNALDKLNKELQKNSVGDSIRDSIEKQGGVGKVLADSANGPNGMIKFTNALKGFFANQLVSGIQKFISQMIDQAREYQKYGVQPYYASSARLLLQTTDLQKIMNENKDTIYAVNGGAEAFAETLIGLQTQTMELAGQDPIMSGKLGAAAQTFTTQLASSTLGLTDLKKRSSEYLSGVKNLTRATGMSAEEIVNWNQTILEDGEIREGLAKATAEERQNILKNVNARVEELKAIGYTTEKAKQLSVDFEKLRRAATPVQRIRGAAQLGVLASQVGMSPEDTRKLMILTRKKRDAGEEAEYQKLQQDLGKRYQEKFNQLDAASNPFADVMQNLSGRVAEALPGFKAVFDATRVEGTISGGRERQGDAAKQGLEVAGGVEKAVLKAGEIAGWVEKIFNFLSGNGLVGVVVGLLGSMLMGGFGGVLSGIGSIIALMKGGLGGAGGGGMTGALGKAGILAATGVAAYEATGMIMKETGLDTALSNKIADWTSEPDPTATTTIEQINERRLKRGQPPLITPPGGARPTAPASVTETTPTAASADPMQSLLNLMHQAKSVQEQIASNTAELLKAYVNTEAVKALLAPGMQQKASMEAARKLQ